MAALALVIAITSVAPNRPAPARTEIADGVFLFRTAPYGEVGLDGNSIVIVSNDGVLVFDTNGTPAAAAAVLAEIRTLTRQPVRYVVNSHWHWDHWYGTEVYQQAFPDVRIIAHEKTRTMMAGPALDFNRPGLETQLPGTCPASSSGLRKLKRPRRHRPSCRAFDRRWTTGAIFSRRRPACITPCRT